MRDGPNVSEEPAAPDGIATSTSAAGGTCERAAIRQDEGDRILSEVGLIGLSNGGSLAHSEVDGQEPQHRKSVNRPSLRSAILHSRGASAGPPGVAHSARSDSSLSRTASPACDDGTAAQPMRRSPATASATPDQGVDTDVQRTLRQVRATPAAQAADGDGVPFKSQSSPSRWHSSAEPLHEAFWTADLTAPELPEHSGGANESPHAAVLANGFAAASNTTEPAATFGDRDASSRGLSGEQLNSAERAALAALDDGRPLGSSPKAAGSPRLASVSHRPASTHDVSMQ